MLNVTRISKRDFYAQGGFSNPKLFRKMVGNAWHYFRNEG